MTSLVRLEVGKRRGAARAVGQNLVSFVDQPLVPEPLEDVPDGFHVFGVHGAVAVPEIDPASHACDDRFPFRGITQNDSAAGFIEFVDAVVLDLLLAGKLELFFHFIFDRKPVAVPAECTFAVFPAHRLVTGDNVLDGSREEVSVMRQPGCERRTVVEYEFIVSFPVLQ